MIDYGAQRCPVCGQPYQWTFTRVEPIDRDSAREIKTFHHSDGRDCRRPIGTVVPR